MEPSTQKLIHTFGALADLGQEIAGTGDFNEMVRTSMHLLLGTLALRRGAVVECNGPGPLRCVSLWGLGDQLLSGVDINEAEMKAFLAGQISDSRQTQVTRGARKKRPVFSPTDPSPGKIGRNPKPDRGKAPPEEETVSRPEYDTSSRRDDNTFSP